MSADFFELVHPMTKHHRRPTVFAAAIVLAASVMPGFALAQTAQPAAQATTVPAAAPTAPPAAGSPVQALTAVPAAPSPSMSPVTPAASATGPAAPTPAWDTSAGSAPAPDASAGVLGLLPHNLSPWGMFLNADIVVKAVISVLALAVVLTWTIWLVKSLELAIARTRLSRALGKLRQVRSLAQAGENLGEGNGVARALIGAAREEWTHSADALEDRDGLKERIALHLERVEAAVGRRMIVGTGVLATAGSTAPFIGLFGTVWGIMNSFVGISKMHTTNLAVVAPGIAEALLATACGLIAAIPAVIIYNHFTRRVGAYKAQVADAASAVMRLASRDISRGVDSNGKRTGGPLRTVGE